jgi:hypothetical protein
MNNKWYYHDGGRKNSGLVLKSVADCVPRAIAIACGKDYLSTTEIVNSFCMREKRRVSWANVGVKKPTLNRIMESLGFKWVNKRFKWKKNMLPKGKYILNLSDHIVTRIDGYFYDVFYSVPEGRMVYGYWIR